MSHLLWQKSSFSGPDDGNNCLELAVGAGDVRHLRESDDPGVILTTSAVKLQAFLLAAKAGEFDHLV
ncbi:DUF397 domain-containing protein [Kitasatospora sp. NPDC092286]|uniref:DUF397 domain-containing protein n=1 Tax=Kitasatospora sp. NPDC092286 TaxID=3364087 RepID=UPI00382165C2